MIKKLLHTNKTTLTAGIFFLSIFSNAQFEQSAKIVGDRESRAEFGTSVAINDNFAIVGASRETIAAGAAYVFKKEENGEWNFSQKIVPDDGFEMSEFGGSMKLAEDLMVIAAGRADVDGVIRAGALYVYDLDNGSWVQSAKITASDHSEGAVLGVNPTTMDIASNTIVAGAPGEFNWLGAVYVFEKDGNNWNETKITPPNAVPFANFGIGVSISENTLIVGASEENNGAGCVYIFERGNGGSWDLVQRITASDPQNNAYFGNSVSIDGNRLVVGAYAEGSVGGNIAAAYVFERNDDGQWSEIQKIPSPVSNENTFFAWMCKIQGDYMVISSPHVYGEEPGKVFLYHRQQNGQWEEIQSIEPNQEVHQMFYGWSIDMNGGNIIVGAPRDDFDVNGENEMLDSGSAFIFQGEIMNTNDPVTEATLVKIYPNPVGDQLNISSKESIELVEIYSISGQKLISAKQSTINVSSLPKGTYILKTKLANGSISTQKFIRK